jgi:exopolyphosphatase/pppGpp-phosphohydrolase
MKKSILDIGTNSLKFFIYDINQQGEIASSQAPRKDLLFHQKFEARLGKDFNHETNEINESSLQKVIDELHNIKAIAQQYEAPNIIAFGTEVFRKANNADHILAKIEDET